MFLFAVNIIINEWGVFHGWVRRGWLGVDWKCGAIVLNVFGQVGPVDGKLCSFELVGVVEEHRWSDNCVDLSHWDLMHNFQFSDVYRKVRRAGQDRGLVFGQLGIFRVSLAPSEPGRRRDITVSVVRWYGRCILTIGWSWVILISFAVPFSPWCGDVGGGGLGERLGCVGVLGSIR